MSNVTNRINKYYLFSHNIVLFLLTNLFSWSLKTVSIKNLLQNWKKIWRTYLSTAGQYVPQYSMLAEDMYFRQHYEIGNSNWILFLKHNCLIFNLTTSQFRQIIRYPCYIGEPPSYIKAFSLDFHWRLNLLLQFIIIANSFRVLFPVRNRKS